MKEHYVSYECAQALKRLGFDWSCDHCYLDKTIDKSGNPYLYQVEMRNWNNFDHEVECFSAPRLDQAAAWMRDCKGIDIEPRVWLVGDKREYRPYVMPPKCKDYIAYPPEESYEKALESGISAALELLGKEVNNG